MRMLLRSLSFDLLWPLSSFFRFLFTQWFQAKLEIPSQIYGSEVLSTSLCRGKHSSNPIVATFTSSCSLICSLVSRTGFEKSWNVASYRRDELSRHGIGFTPILQRAKARGRGSSWTFYVSFRISLLKTILSLLWHLLALSKNRGGKTVQAMALSPELPSNALSHLISVDMSPARGPLSKEFEVSFVFLIYSYFSRGLAYLSFLSLLSVWF